MVDRWEEGKSTKQRRGKRGRVTVVKGAMEPRSGGGENKHSGMGEVDEGRRVKVRGMEWQLWERAVVRS